MANFPLLRSAFGLRQATSDETAGGGPLALATAELIADYAGPVVIFDGTGAVLTANGLAKPVLAALDGVAGMGLRSILEDVLQGGGVTSKRFQLPIPTGEGVFDITLLPEGGVNGGSPSRVLFLARDSTFDVNFGRALVASRQMFKDLVAYSADFVWETDAEGCFTFVSGRGLLGYSPDELDGRPARDLLANQTADRTAEPGPGDGQEAPLNPFESLAHLDEVECWLLNRNGERTCVRASCLSVFNDDGGLQGVRGVCRDITRDKQRQADLARAQERERLSRSIVDSIRDAVTPEEMFAAAATHAAMAASHIWILRDDKAGGLHQAAGHLDDDAPPLDIMTEALATLSGDPERVHHTVLDGCQILLVPCHFRYQPKGVLGVALTEKDALEEAVTTLLDIAAQLGIAMAQAEIQERLEELSSVDELTGLLNRRGFDDSVGKRIAQHRRKGRTGILLYIDMDYFKFVNDTHGHQVGDAALVALAKLLSGDGKSRQGGDEFAMWLEETDLEGGRHKADELLEIAARLRKYSGDAEHPLGFSISIAVADPAFDDDLDQLLNRADSTLYEAKRGRRGRGQCWPN
ncbi:MAG: diguanylate cyclase, partial [Alphaproteobacteria bacterium]